MSDTAAGSPVFHPDRLAAVARTGLLDTAPEPAFDELAALAARLLDAPFAFVTLMDDTRSFWKSRIGIAADGPTQNTVEESFCRYVVASGEPLIVGDTASEPMTADNPSIASMGVRAWAGYPLRSPEGHTLGSFCVVDTVEREWTPTDVETLRVLAEAAGRELALRASVDEAERSNRQLALLAEVGRSLSETLDAGEVADRLAGLVVPALGDWSLVSLIDETDTVTDVAWSHVREDMWPVLAAFAADRLTTPDAEAATPGGWRTHRPVVVDGRVPGQGLATLRSDRAEEAFRTLDPGTYGVWPLTSGPTAHGVLVIARDAGAPAFTPAEIDLAANIAQHAGTVVHNARLYERQRTVTDELADVARQLESASEHDRIVARALQQAMLTTLPQPDHLQVAARYLTADGYDQVGGDWYDALVPTDGATTLMIGDVMGHDIAAATVMGQLRNLLRGIAWEHDDEPPSALIARLDHAASDLGLAVMTTLTVARIEHDAGAPGGLTLAWSTAGHPPPVLLGADGRPRLLTTVVDPPLAVLPGVARRDHRVGIGPGDTLLLYTDGLVETRADDLEDRHAELVDVLGRHAQLELGPLLDTVIAAMVGDRPDDDVALIAVRLHPDAPPRPIEPGLADSVTIESTPDAPSLARRLVTAHGAHLPAEVVEDALLLVSELVSNAVRHGRPEIALSLLTTPSTLRIAVSDQGVEIPAARTPDHATPVPVVATSGRGLAIVEAVAQAWGIVAAEPPPGKTVWFELDVR